MQPQLHERVRARMEGHHCPLDQIVHLSLDGINMCTLNQAVNQEIEKATNVEFLTMNRCHLQSLQNLPNI